MLEDPRYGMNPIGQMIRELEFYKRWFPLAVTAVLVLMALLTCYIFYVIGGILFISNKEHFKLISVIIRSFKFISNFCFKKNTTCL